MNTCAHCGGFELARRKPPAQPRSVFGSPEDIIEHGTDVLARQTERLGISIAKAVHGLTSPRQINAAIKRAGREWPVRRMALPLQGELLHGAMLGALDSDFESRTNRPVAVPSFSALHADPFLLAGYDRSKDPAFATRPVGEARKRFEQRQAVTRPVYDAMTDAARRRSVTVAGAATADIVRTVQRELVRQVAEGADLRDFSKRVVPRLEQAGWTPVNDSHAENVLRTNIGTAYNAGRAHQMTQPTVLRFRPFWQIVTVNDGPPRQRPTHQAAHLVVLRADDPFWLKAYPPFGYQCRCRVRNLSQREGEPLAVLGSTIRDLPDKGFTSGLPNLDVPPVPPANDTIPPPPEPAKPLRQVLRVEHVYVEDAAPQAVVDQISRDLVERAGIEQQPRSIPDVTIAVQRTLKGEDAGAHGLYYGSDRRVIKIGLDVEQRHTNEPLEKAWTIASAAPDIEGYIGRIAVHEYGHHLHLQVEGLALGSRDDAVVKRAETVFKLTTDAWKRVEAGEVKPPTRYAGTNRVELWAESFTAYRYEPEWLKKRHPAIFKMVRAVLTEMGMPL